MTNERIGLVARLALMLNCGISIEALSRGAWYAAACSVLGMMFSGMLIEGARNDGTSESAGFYGGDGIGDD